MLDAACRLILDEVSLPGSAPGGKVEFKRTLIISFLFKFYLEVSQILKEMVSGTDHVFTFAGLRASENAQSRKGNNPSQKAIE